MTMCEFNYKLGAAREAARTQPPEIVRNFMIESKMQQKQFAAAVGVSIAAVSQWLSGKRKVPGPVLAYITLSRSFSAYKAFMSHDNPMISKVSNA